MEPFSRAEAQWLRSHGRPERAQHLLDSLPYRCDDSQPPAASALREWRAHCLDGALLAAAALTRAGYKPHIIDLCAERDDDHVLCAYRWRGYWGAVAKSNFPGLRFREPIFRTPRELVLSYFEFYFNLKREKSLRSFSEPVPLPPVSRIDWECDHRGPLRLLEILARARHHRVLTASREQLLTPVDDRLFRSQMVGVALAGAHGGASYSRSSAKRPVKRPKNLASRS